jgi:hypothetical protein
MAKSESPKLPLNGLGVAQPPLFGWTRMKNHLHSPWGTGLATPKWLREGLTCIFSWGYFWEFMCLKSRVVHLLDIPFKNTEKLN